MTDTASELYTECPIVLGVTLPNDITKKRSNKVNKSVTSLLKSKGGVNYIIIIRGLK